MLLPSRHSNEHRNNCPLVIGALMKQLQWYTQSDPWGKNGRMKNCHLAGSDGKSLCGKVTVGVPQKCIRKQCKLCLKKASQ
jgi:hypothetical protein